MNGFTLLRHRTALSLVGLTTLFATHAFAAPGDPLQPVEAFFPPGFGPPAAVVAIDSASNTAGDAVVIAQTRDSSLGQGGSIYGRFFSADGEGDTTPQLLVSVVGTNSELQDIYHGSVAMSAQSTRFWLLYVLEHNPRAAFRASTEVLLQEFSASGEAIGQPVRIVKLPQVTFGVAYGLSALPVVSAGPDGTVTVAWGQLAAAAAGAGIPTPIGGTGVITAAPFTSQILMRQLDTLSRELRLPTQVAIAASAQVEIPFFSQVEVPPVGTGFVTEPRLAYAPDGTLLVAWSRTIGQFSRYGVSASELRVRRYTGEGFAAAQTLVADIPDEAVVASVSANDTRYAVTWQERDTRTSLVQAYDNAGGAINTASVQTVNAPGVGLFTSGAYVWTFVPSASSPDLARGVYTQFFDAAGGAVGEPMLVNPSGSAATQAVEARVETAADDVLVVWRTRPADPEPDQVYLRRLEGL